MKKSFGIPLLVVAVIAGLIFGLSRHKSPALEPDSAQEEGRRFREVLRERGIEQPTEEMISALCKEGLVDACAEEGRLLLVKCQQAGDKDLAVCESARKSLGESCKLGSIHSCDVIFQADELVALRMEATDHLEKFCRENKPQACKVFEVALRNWIDLDRKNGSPDSSLRNRFREKYVKVSNINCDRGFYFSCLALIDEDRSTASVPGIEAAETRLRGICKKAGDRFEREDCLSFAEYLSATGRQIEAEKYASEVCAEGSEAGCLSALRIQLQGLKAGQVAEHYAAIKATCADSKKAALLEDHCQAFRRAADAGVSTWERLRTEPALLSSSHSVTFDELLTIHPRETY